ncbi:hypothetical protein BFU36_06405 [Sulfolobus sp. A20]|uniref:hypothetical protein n=1 Tax=Sulfolobaceae TaxID=118883 RepID=UPI0008460DFD|nr:MULTISPECIES: hypothetical protein [unclassified Sulfolobus]TRM74419.1 hypothetical protein DJ523_04940 [Sulfolobus sp. E5]TRM76331.1 hypothetical protein DJ532_07800 [Sulfolobus sp. A20-N-F8]TRM77539.1 hypothetical protein DJ528_06505 [Sulfolobus sp. B5]TRM80829.1 hypothetical protein DJ524_06210 [Sulfolobus sp. D5]TRM84301.1 hypothetical protein DJ531_01145 [Sulfolobus sp. A20-N-F6]TRM89616.1 hypothetical protein DJ529_01255 [Sulfolobus sp. C3]TRM97889.1 hypothetical protein DJ527_11500
METPFYKYALMRNFIREVLEQEKLSDYVKDRLHRDEQMRNRFCNEDEDTIRKLIDEVIEYITSGKGKDKRDEVLNAIRSFCTEGT